MTAAPHLHGNYATFVFLALTLVLGIASRVSADEIRNWPCQLSLAETFSPEDVWGGRLPEPMTGRWRLNLQVKQLVEFAANPENRPAQGRAKIIAFTENLQEDRRGELMQVFSGLMEEFNLLRGFLIEGIRQYVLRARILQDAMVANQTSLAVLSDTDPAAARRQREGYEQARFWDARRLDDALEEAEFLCGRYGYLDKKLRLLTEAIRGAL